MNDLEESGESGKDDAIKATGSRIVRWGWTLAAVGLLCTALVGVIFGARGLQAGVGVLLFATTRTMVLAGLLTAVVGYRWTEVLAALASLFASIAPQPLGEESAGGNEMGPNMADQTMAVSSANGNRLFWIGLSAGFVAVPLILVVTDNYNVMGRIGFLVLICETFVAMLILALSRRRLVQSFGRGGLAVCLMSILAGTFSGNFGMRFPDPSTVLLALWGMCLAMGLFAICLGEALGGDGGRFRS